MERTIKFTCIAKKWFDRINGNTYHSVRVIRHKDNSTIVGQFRYGYGNHYQQTALNLMVDAKWLPTKYAKPAQHGGNCSYLYERENNYPILWTVSEGLKRDCVANGKF